MLGGAMSSHLPTLEEECINPPLLEPVYAGFEFPDFRVQVIDAPLPL
jgi:hypothetical protein